MVGIIEANRHDLGDHTDARPEPRPPLDQRQVARIERPQPGKAIRRQDVPGNIRDLPGQIPDPTVGIEWPLPAGVQPKLSAKDLTGKSFSEIEKFP